MSDTHNLHWSVEERFPLQEAELLVHTGDFSEDGSEEQVASFVAWLRHIAGRFVAIVVIPGNHDWRTIRRRVDEGEVAAETAAGRGFMRQWLELHGGGLPENCHLPDHEGVQLCGLVLWGSPWCPWHPADDTEGDEIPEKYWELMNAWLDVKGGAEEAQEQLHRFGEIPEGMDMLLTHGPAERIFDCLGTPGLGCGSAVLKRDIYRAKPRLHLFGHVHEQRGEWRRSATRAGYEGGVEYRVAPQAEPFETSGEPRPDYPCEVVSCAAMRNRPHLEGTEERLLAGPARLILVEPRVLEVAQV